jgi:hypothetical protein
MTGLSKSSWTVYYGGGLFLGYDNRGAMATGYPIPVKELPRVAFFHTWDKAEAAMVSAYKVTADLTQRFPKDARVISTVLTQVPLEEF